MEAVRSAAFRICSRSLRTSWRDAGMAEGEVGAAEHHGHLVVGLMGHAAGQPPHRFEPVCLLELFLGVPLLGHFLDGDVDAHHPAIGGPHRVPVLDPDPLPARRRGRLAADLEPDDRLAALDHRPELGLHDFREGGQDLAHRPAEVGRDRQTVHGGELPVDPNETEVAVQHAEADRGRDVDGLDLLQPGLRPLLAGAKGFLGHAPGGHVAQYPGPRARPGCVDAGAGTAAHPEVTGTDPDFARAARSGLHQREPWPARARSSRCPMMSV